MLAGTSAVASPALHLVAGYMGVLPDPLPIITSTLAASGTYGSALASYLISAANSPASYVATGLPSGLSFDSTTGLISGTPGAAGNFNITIGAVNESGTGSATLVLTIGRASQTITFGALSGLPYTSAPIALSASASSGLTVTFSVPTGSAIASGASLTLTGTGGITVRASQAGDANYLPAADVDRSFNVSANFASWQLQKLGGPGGTNAGPTAVYGQDGLPNLTKYALGLEPQVNATTGIPSISLSGPSWVYTYTRPADRTDVTVTVEACTDLASWSSSNVTLTLTGSSGGVDTYTATYPVASAPNLFFRLKVTQP